MDSSPYIESDRTPIYRKRKHGNASFAQKRMFVILPALQVLSCLVLEIFFHRSCDRNPNSRPLPHVNNVAFCLSLRLADITARSHTRECMDYLQLNHGLFCPGPATFFTLCRRTPHILIRWAEGDIAAVISTATGLPLISFVYSCWKMPRRPRECSESRETVDLAMSFRNERYSRPSRCLLYLQQNLARWFLCLDSVWCEVSFLVNS